MFQDGLGDLPVFDEADDPHDSPTLRAGQGINFVNLLNQPRPVLPVFLRTFIGFQDAGGAVVFVGVRKTASFANQVCCRFLREKGREQEKSVIDDEARTTSRFGKREGLAPLMVCMDIVPFSPSFARVFRETPGGQTQEIRY